MEKSFIVDVITKLYIATDSNPVDAHTYELCSDLLDVVRECRERVENVFLSCLHHGLVMCM